MFLAIMGCGGGSSDQSGTLALTVTPTSLNAGDTGSAVANYKPANSSKNPVGLVISFATDRPDIVALSSTSQGVGSDGTASISFTAVSVAVDTTVKIIAQTGGLSQFQQIVIKAAPGSTGSIPPVVTLNPQSITFTSAVPSQISLKGYGTTSNPETSIVTFTVNGTDGNPLAGQNVDFALNTTVGGITIIPTSGVSSSNGQVQTIISSGNMATTVQVKATVRGTAITANSTQLVVAGGPPDQDSFSIALSDLNPEAYNIDGKTVAVTAHLADHFNNPVADGTAVYFTTDGGSIQNSCVTRGGACSVTWTSANPRPAVPGTNPGTVAILAFAVGEESFTDLNNNGIADGGPCSPILPFPPGLPGVGQAQQCGEFTDTPDAFRDDNFNHVRDATEPFYNLTGVTTYSPVDGIYEGSFAPSTSTTSRSKYIFYTSKLIMSTSDAIITQVDASGFPIIPAAVSGPGAVYVNVMDAHGNTMPSGTTITISVPFGTATGTTSLTVPQNVVSGGVTLHFNIAASTSPKIQSGIITVTVKSPGGVISTGTIDINGLF